MWEDIGRAQGLVTVQYLCHINHLSDHNPVSLPKANLPTEVQVCHASI